MNLNRHTTLLVLVAIGAGTEARRTAVGAFDRGGDICIGMRPVGVSATEVAYNKQTKHTALLVLLT
jgi:hypothetical protein